MVFPTFEGQEGVIRGRDSVRDWHFLKGNVKCLHVFEV